MIAPLPWSVAKDSRHTPWTNACSILDAAGDVVCYLTRGYQDGPSWDNAELIVAAVNAYKCEEVK